MSVDGSKTSLLTLGTNILGSIISSSLVNFFIFSKIYAPFDVINYNDDDEGTNRYSKVKAIRIQKAYIPTDSESGEMIHLEKLQDLENILKVLGFNIDLSKALEPISKEEFDSMDIPTLPLN